MTTFKKGRRDNKLWLGSVPFMKAWKPCPHGSCMFTSVNHYLEWSILDWSYTDIGSDNLEMCFKIMDAYVVLCASDPEQFTQVTIETAMQIQVGTCGILDHLSLQLCGQVIVHACQAYICDVKPQGVVTIVKVMEHIAQLYPSHFPVLLQPLLPTVLRKLIHEEVRGNST